ncbi:MAG TPA: hypothetical protein VIG74_07175 [Alphaproteobacteria bacterium]
MSDFMAELNEEYSLGKGITATLASVMVIESFGPLLDKNFKQEKFIVSEKESIIRHPKNAFFLAALAFNEAEYEMSSFVVIKVPFDALKILAVHSRQTGEIINLKKDNWENLTQQYRTKTGPFAPEMPPQSRGPG